MSRRLHAHSSPPASSDASGSIDLRIIQVCNSGKPELRRRGNDLLRDGLRAQFLPIEIAPHVQALLLRNPERLAHRERWRDQDLVSASSRCNGIPTAIRATRTARSNSSEINEAYDVLKDGDKRAAYDRFGHAAFEQGNGAGATWLRRRFRLGLLRYLRGHFRHGRRPCPLRQRPRARRRSSLQHGDHARGRLLRQDRRNPHPDLGHLRSLFGLRRQDRHASESLQHLRRCMAACGMRRASSRWSVPVRPVTAAAR